ncbi:hypothetical protein JTE90_013741 [Oedothorax gibbosus]|uniref:RFX1-4/6/8-like BCD domain-containing protein n=1 Tax=Oedothorax gibbosus TaxID=931172 RepID=A0AAV6UZS6_9ARAC|nr:hypothetical protein JTE90_013741 [Oedothorax gibbosus]
MQSFLLHFWQGFPDHLIAIFMDPITLDLIASCDSILYLTLTDILIPSEVMKIPEKLLKGIQNVAMNWEKWLECSLENMAFYLKQLKIEQGRRFSKNLKRNATFLHLSQVSRPLLNESVLKSLNEEITQLKKERWFGRNISSSRKIEVLYSILERRKFDSWIVCMDHLIQDIINNSSENVEENTRNFMLHWIFLLKEISFYLTGCESKNFVAFHLLSCLIQEYLMLAFENLWDEKQERLIQVNLKRHANTSVTNNKKKEETKEKNKQRRDLKKRTNITSPKYPDSDVSHNAKPQQKLNGIQERNSSMLLSEYNKYYSEAQYPHRFPGRNITSYMEYMYSNNHQIIGQNGILSHSIAELPCQQLVNEQQTSLTSSDKLKNLKCYTQPLQHSYFKKDSMVGHTDAYCPMAQTPIAIEPGLSFIGYTLTGDKGFVTGH